MSPSQPMRAAALKATDTLDVQRFHINLSVGSNVNKYPGKQATPSLKRILLLTAHNQTAKQHARKVASKLGLSRGLIYLVGKPTVFLDDSDQAIPFRQRRYFYYLSGSNEPDCYLTYDIAKDHLTLYVPDFDLRQTVWMGPTISIGEALDR